MYEGYDLPSDLSRPSTAVSILDAFGQWRLLEYSFHSVLGIDLEQVWRVKSWRWFTTRLSGLLGDPDSPLARHFAPEPEQPEGVRDGR